MKEKKNLKDEVFKAYFMIAVFVLYFLFSLLLVIGTIVLNLIVLYSAIKEPAFFVLYIYLLPLDFIVYVSEISPVIALLKENSHYNGGIEVTEAEAPLLFGVIRDVAEHTKCKMPKHVYLSEEVNASVSFDSLFISIFFPNPKNLTIGIDLFTGLNISELRSIIAHEFGHFSQKTMHAGSCVYVAENLCDMYKQIISAQRTGSILYWIFLWIKWFLITLIYKGIHRTYRSLQRRMEFDADEIVASVVGANSFVSSECKIEALQYQYQHFSYVLEDLYNQGIQVYDRTACHDIWWNVFPHNRMYDITPTMLLTQIPTEASKGFITIIDLNEETHPTTKARIENIKAMNLPDETIDTIPAISILPSIIWEKKKEENMKEYNWQYYDTTAFANYCTQYATENYGQGELYKLLSHNIVEFDIDILPAQKDVFLPKFTEVQDILEKYVSTQYDERTLHYLEHNLLKHSILQYKEQRVQDASNLRELHQEDVEALQDVVLQLDKQTAAYLLAQSTDEEEKNKIRTLYKDIFLFQKALYDMQTVKLNTLITIKEETTDDEEGERQVDIHREEKLFREIIKQFDRAWLQQYLTDDIINAMLEYAQTAYHCITYTDWNKIKEFISVVQWTEGVLYNGADKCKMKLSRIPNKCGIVLE